MINELKYLFKIYKLKNIKEYNISWYVGLGIWIWWKISGGKWGIYNDVNGFKQFCLFIIILSFSWIFFKNISQCNNICIMELI